MDLIAKSIIDRPEGLPIIDTRQGQPRNQSRRCETRIEAGRQLELLYITIYDTGVNFCFDLLFQDADPADSGTAAVAEQYDRAAIFG